MEKAYAHALTRTVVKGTSEKDVVESLLRHLREAGRMKLLPSILRELKVLNARKADAVLLEVASEKEAKSALEEARKEGISAKDVVVNPSLIRGWRARSGSTLLDRSAKRLLIDLYRRIAS